MNIHPEVESTSNKRTFYYTITWPTPRWKDMLLSLCLTLKLQIIVFNITIKNIGDAAFLKIIPWRTKTLVWLLSWLYHWMASADFYLLQEGRWIHLLHFFPRLLLTIISFLWWKVCYTFICRTFLQVTLNFAADTFMC